MYTTLHTLHTVQLYRHYGVYIEESGGDTYTLYHGTQGTYTGAVLCIHTHRWAVQGVDTYKFTNNQRRLPCAIAIRPQQKL